MRSAAVAAVPVAGVLVALAAPALAEKPVYTPPWQLRPASVATAVRLDTAAARYESPEGDGGGTLVAFLSGSIKLGRFAPFVRLGTAADAPPGDAEGASVLVNPAVGATWLAVGTPTEKLTITLATSLPLGMGGGDTAAMEDRAAVRAGLWARAALDNAMFAVNDLAVFGGADGAWVRGKLTLQAEVTLFQLFRVRGEAVQPDETKTNLTGGLAAGWAFGPRLAASVELRAQTWLSTPSMVDSDPSQRESFSLAVGVRSKLDLGGGVIARPGIALARGLDDPLGGRGYGIALLDLPVIFP